MWPKPKMQLQKKPRMFNGRELSVNDVAYKCDVTRPLTKKLHLRFAEGEWKSHFYNHKLSFKHKRYSNKTTLPSYMWHLKRNFKWSVLRCVPPYSNILKKCLLCLYGNLEIVTYEKQKELSNKRSGTAWKVSTYWVIPVPYFPVFGLNTGK